MAFRYYELLRVRAERHLLHQKMLRQNMLRHKIFTPARFPSRCKVPDLLVQPSCHAIPARSDLAGRSMAKMVSWKRIRARVSSRVYADQDADKRRNCRTVPHARNSWDFLATLNPESGPAVWPRSPYAQISTDCSRLAWRWSDRNSPLAHLAHLRRRSSLTIRVESRLQQHVTVNR